MAMPQAICIKLPIPRRDEITAGAVGIAGSPARANIPAVYLAPGGNILGTGTVSVALGGNGTPAEYTMTDTFFAPANFYRLAASPSRTLLILAPMVSLSVLVVWLEPPAVLCPDRAHCC